jgi:hypothetical protein
MSMPSNEDPLDRPSRAKRLSLAKGSCGRTYGQIGIGDHGNEGLMGRLRYDILSAGTEHLPNAPYVIAIPDIMNQRSLLRS